MLLDVGCGCGATVLELGRLVAPNGTVLGVDVSVPMLGRARERVAAAALKGVNLVVSDAQTYEFPRGAVDLLFSRFGVMFFADPVAAFTNLRRTMKQGGRLLFACWRPMAENSWFHVPLNAAKDLLPAQPPADPLAPGPFAFADPERVKRVLAEAGWQDVSATPFDCADEACRAGATRRGRAMFATRVGALARMLGEVDEETRQRARAAGDGGAEGTRDAGGLHARRRGLAGRGLGLSMAGS